MGGEGRGGDGRFPLNLTLYEYEPLVNVALVLLLKIYDFEVEVSRVLRDQHVPGPPPPLPLSFVPPLPTDGLAGGGPAVGTLLRVVQAGLAG